MQTTLFSGIRPTGCVQLGNYLGALKNWVHLVEQMDSHFFCVVDQHALTTATDAKNLKDHTKLIVAAYLAAGIDPNKSTIFVQSHVPGHSELSWYLSCVTRLGWLNRMTQFKDKAGKNKENATLGLYGYPVLMAADILLYGTTHVPVGEDQKQHVELTRDIAHAFNVFVEKEVFSLPEPVIPKQSARVMSLRDGTAKMSKSDPSEYSRINLTDSDETLALKIKKAKTDSLAISETSEDLKDRPEALNLITIYATLSNTTPDAICQKHQGVLFSAFKKDLTDLLVTTLAPIRNRIHDLMTDDTQISTILKQGAIQARERSQETLQVVRNALNLYT